MASLLDIAHTKKPATIDGHTFEIYALSARTIADLAARFPSLMELMSGGRVDALGLIQQGAGVVGAIIAAGVNKYGDEAHEKAAAGLPINMQVDFLSAILDVTMPGGSDPFVSKVKAIGARLGIKQDEAPSADKSSNALPESETQNVHLLNGSSHTPAAYSAS